MRTREDCKIGKVDGRNPVCPGFRLRGSFLAVKMCIRDSAYVGRYGKRRSTFLKNALSALHQKESILPQMCIRDSFFVRTSLPPVEGIFFDGQIFDAYK